MRVANSWILCALVMAGTTRCGVAYESTPDEAVAPSLAPEVGQVTQSVILPPTGGDIPDFYRCANENETCGVGPALVAFGADGHFNYGWVFSRTPCNVTWFGDPIQNVKKACFFANLHMIARENETGLVERGPREVAYGRNTVFTYETLNNGTFHCDNQVFGDPAKGVSKDCAEVLYWYSGDVAEEGTMTGLDNTPIAYGANGRYVFEVASGSRACTNQAFGRDPANGVPKRCYRARLHQVAVEGQSTSGAPVFVRYGSGLNGNFLSIRPPTTQFQCNNASFGGDPDVGHPKSCWVDD